MKQKLTLRKIQVSKEDLIWGSWKKKSLIAGGLEISKWQTRLAQFAVIVMLTFLGMVERLRDADFIMHSGLGHEMFVICNTGKTETIISHYMLFVDHMFVWNGRGPTEHGS